MTAKQLRAKRLANQRAIAPRFETPAEVVGWLTAVQAQDYAGSLWGIGLRTTRATEADVERAIAARQIVRTWPMRGTLHFVAAADARWMVELLAPRMITRAAGRHRELGLDAKAFARSRDALERALAGGKALSRPDAYACLARGGVPPDGQRGIHILAMLAMQGVLCFGARSGRQPTFVLLHEWLPKTRSLDRDEALGEVARRYVASHGPATLADFAWWTGLPAGEARRALDIAKLVARDGYYGGDGPATRAAIGGHLLPSYDEYTVAYRDRSACLDPAHAERTRNGIFSPVAVLDGKIAGTWRRTTTRAGVTITVDMLANVRGGKRALAKAAARYAEFVGKPTSLVV